jgi:hypothetical protein
MKPHYCHKAVNLSQALQLIRSYAKEESLGRIETNLLEAYLETAPTDPNGLIRLDALIGQLSNFKKAFAENDAAFLEQRRGYKTERIVNVIEFAESREFLALKGTLWQSTKEDLWKIFHEQPVPFEVLLSGAAGTAKSTKSWIGTCYSLYLLSCMWNPQLELGMAPVDEIFLIFQSMRLATAQDTLFERLKRGVDASPYFQEHFPRNQKNSSKLLFPGNVTVKPVTGATDAVLGLNAIGGVITEINFMPVHSNSVRLQHSDKQVFDVGAEMYRNLRNRIIGRYKHFIEQGDFVGRLIIDSARNYVGDFATRKIEEAKKDTTILVIERTLWDARSHEYPRDAPKFPVELATDYRPARILQCLEHADDPEHIIWIPEVFRTDCEQDLEQALKDLAGEPSTSTGRFLPFPKEIAHAQEAYTERTGERTLFRIQDVSLQALFGITSYDAEQDRLDWTLLIDWDYLEQVKLEGDFPFALHVDTSLSGDATGLALGRIVDTKLIEKGHFYSAQDRRPREIHGVFAPVYLIDGVLRIYAKSGEQIDLNVIRDLVLELNRHIRIKYASADWMESAAMLQAWRSKRIIAGHVSVDKTPTSYFELKHAIRDQRIFLPPHQFLDRELRRLKRITKGGTIKIDHEPNESKDCADAVAGVVGVLQRCEGKYRSTSPEKPSSG